MVHHVQDSAFHAHHVEGKHGKQRQTHVRDGAVSNQTLHVVLHPAHQAHAQDANECERGKEGCQRQCAFGRHGERKPQRAVLTDLDDNACKHHGSSRGSFAVRQWQPGMHRNERHLHRESAHDGKEDPPLRAGRERLSVLHQGLHTEVDGRTGISGVPSGQVDESNQ